MPKHAINDRTNGRTSQADQVLISLYRVAKGTSARVPYEDLVIQAWKDFPESFSLRNHPEHPDASDIHKRLYSTLKKNGHIVSLGNKMFRLTEDGLDRARRLVNSGGTRNEVSDPGDSSRLSRTEEAFLHHARRTRTFIAWQAGDLDRIVDYDARVFFQFSTSTPVDERERRVNSALIAVEKAAELGISDGRELSKLAQFLKSSFESSLL